MDAPTFDAGESRTDAEAGPVKEPHRAGPFIRWTLAAVSVAAAAIHIGFAQPHLDEDWAHGGFFLVVGWFQLAWAALVVARPRRWVFAAGVIVNLAVVVVWAVSRTSGLPFGPTADVSEDIGTPDVLATILEGVIVIGSAALLARPKVADRPVRLPRVAFGVTAVLALLAVTAASASITPRFAGSHAHGTEGHDESAAHDDMAGHDATAGHDDGGHTTAVAGPYDGDSPCEVARPTGSEDGADGDDGEGHDHRGPLPQEPLDEATLDKLAAEQAQALEVVRRFPTVADAEAGGYVVSTPYIPCIGAHYTNLNLLIGFNPATPSELLYDGTEPTSKLVGLSYLLYNPGGPPEGFSGPNDVWHGHSTNGGMCFKNNVVVALEQVSVEECTELGGQKAALEDVWMVHDWIVPGWACSWGVFAAECPELGGKEGEGPFA
jgi:hypothetical protein